MHYRSPNNCPEKLFRSVIIFAPMVYIYASFVRTYTDAGGQTRAALSMASLHSLKIGRHCVPGIPNDTILVPVLAVIVPVLAVMPYHQKPKNTTLGRQGGEPKAKAWAKHCKWICPWHKPRSFGTNRTMTARDVTKFCAFFSACTSGHFLSTQFGSDFPSRGPRKRSRNKKNPLNKMKRIQWRRQPEIADLCPLSRSNVSQVIHVTNCSLGVKPFQWPQRIIMRRFAQFLKKLHGHWNKRFPCSCMGAMLCPHQGLRALIQKRGFVHPVIYGIATLKVIKQEDCQESPKSMRWNFRKTIAANFCITRSSEWYATSTATTTRYDTLPNREGMILDGPLVFWRGWTARVLTNHNSSK